jgi:DNA-directed RNA polymerase subunit M/transcription elongation factor TFIIS
MKEHKKRRAKGTCPKCNSRNVTYRSDPTGGTSRVTLKASCDECGTKFREFCKLLLTHVKVGWEEVVQG